MEVDVRYVRSGGVSIAYQVVGEAETDLVFVPDFCSNLVYGWESEYWRPFYERLARSFRLILFDKRGTGLSDRGGASRPWKPAWRTCVPCSTRSGRRAPSSSVPTKAV